MDRIGRYRIVKELGRGAMGIVYLATDPTIGRSVAIKTLRLRDVDNSEQREKLRERLFREARSAGVLSHPNIVTIYDMAEEDGVAYIAMEYVDGPTLDELMSSGKPIESAKFFGILRQTATALDYAHTKGIVHRDIKPANIMIGRDGNVKVTDFGIAKINTAVDSFTMTGTLVGTPNYMSPEQVQGGEVTGRSDQFSLAVIAYEILTGERPFPGQQLSTVVYKIVAEEPVSPQKLNRTLGAYIDGVLRKALSKKPASRYRTCAEFVGSLETTCASTKGWVPVARGASLDESTMGGVAPRALPAAIPNPPSRKSSKGQPAPVETPAPRERQKESHLLPLLAAIAMVAVVFALLTWQGGDKTSASPSATSSNATTDAGNVRPPAASPTGSDSSPGSSSSVGGPENKPVPERPLPEARSAEPVTKAPSETAREPEPAPKVDPPKETAPKSSKPSAMKPAEVAELRPAPVIPHLSPAFPRQPGKAQDIFIPTNPVGALVTIDGGESCATPCTLSATPGLHSISVRLDGYQEERREIHIGSEGEDVPLISLRKSSGTLMITSVPPGATITINDKVQSQKTPAQISLAPGVYRVAVEKDGLRQVDRVEIKNGNTNFVKIPLE